MDSYIQIYLTICILNSKFCKMWFVPYLPKLNYCISQTVSVLQIQAVTFHQNSTDCHLATDLSDEITLCSLWGTKWIFIYKADSFHSSIWQHHCTGSQFLQSHCTGPGLIPGQSMWELWWTKWHRERFFPPEYFSFSLSVSFHQCSIFIFIYMLLLPDGQAGEAWEPSKKQCSFRNWEVFDIKELSLFFHSSRG